jgi:S1-C subfamily serine protease
MMQTLIRNTIVLLFCASCDAQLAAAEPAANVEQSVVKIFSSIRAPDTLRPWSKQAASEAVGSGVIIDGNRILTNAHVVAYASQVQVQVNQAGDKVSATVVASSPGVDLALLKLEDETMFATHKPVLRDSALPKQKDEVLAYGFPTGGATLSITKGIVSRVEFAAYNASGGGLRVQIDAAINPGNSGGPVMANGKMVGLAFSSLLSGQNISYIIPDEEIELFLRDAADGRIDGKPRIFEDVQPLESRALRASLNLPADVTGMVVRHPYEGAGPSPLREWDVITRIGDTPIDDQGTVRVGDQRVRFGYLVQKLQSNGHVPLTVVRTGKQLTVQLPVSAERPQLVQDLKGKYPPYFIYGPLVFSSASIQFMQAFGPRLGMLTAAGSPLAAHFADPPDRARQEFVVVTAPLLTHRLAVGYSNPAGIVIDSVNGVHITSLTHLVTVLRDLKDEYVTFRSDQRYGENLVFSRQDIVAATEEILADNGIRAQGSNELLTLWQAKAQAQAQ